MNDGNCSPTDVFAGKRLRTLREERFMSRESLARILGMDEHDVERFELGQSRLGGGNIVKLCAEFAVPPSSFFPKAEVN